VGKEKKNMEKVEFPLCGYLQKGCAETSGRVGQAQQLNPNNQSRVKQNMGRGCFKGKMGERVERESDQIQSAARNGELPWSGYPTKMKKGRAGRKLACSRGEPGVRLGHNTRPRGKRHAPPRTEGAGRLNTAPTRQ